MNVRTSCLIVVSALLYAHSTAAMYIPANPVARGTSTVLVPQEQFLEMFERRPRAAVPFPALVLKRRGPSYI
ncbi:hypothetical protein B0H11DRAFT_2225486 [Mycena galericulata]|nr:hypothetical protein B0H11DRAFT_2225486 [Mycena galericulata]